MYSVYYWKHVYKKICMGAGLHVRVSLSQRKKINRKIYNYILTGCLIIESFLKITHFHSGIKHRRTNSSLYEPHNHLYLKITVIL